MLDPSTSNVGKSIVVAELLRDSLLSTWVCNAPKSIDTYDQNQEHKVEQLKRDTR